MKTLFDRVVRFPGVRRLKAALPPAGIYAWVMSALLVASSASHAEDLDIYTKALTSGVTGSPVLIFQLDNSGSMMRSMVSTSNATNLLDQRLYRLVDVAMAQATGMKSTFQVGVTTYSGSSTGQRLQIAQALETEFSSAAGTTTFSVVDEHADVTQTYTSGVTRGSSVLSMGQATTGSQTKGATKLVFPYAGSWPFTYPDTFDLPVPTGSGGQASDAMAGLTGNVVLYYRHYGTSNTQIFKVEGATANTYLTLYTETGTTPLRSTSTKSEQTSGDCSSVVVTGNNSCLSHSLSSNTWYRLVIGTDAVNQVGVFTLNLGQPTRAHATDGMRVETRPRKLPLRAGVQIPRIDIPRGATISNAYLEFKSQSNQSNVGKWRAGIDTAVEPSAVTAGLYTGRTVSWTASSTLNAWSTDEVGGDTRLSVTGLVQAQVNNPNWCGGDMVFLADVLPTANGTISEVRRDAFSFDGLWGDDTAAAPKLVVQWVAPGAPAAGSPCNVRTYTIPVANSSDDVQQNVAGDIVFDANTLTVNSTREVGLRFPLIPLPQGVTITDARLQIMPDSGVAQTFKIKVIDEVNAPPFSGTVSSLDTYTYAVDSGSGTDFINWTPASWTAGVAVQSENLAPLIQSAFDLDDWKYDNAIGLVLEGTSASGSIFRAWERNVDGASSTSTDRTKYGQMAARLVLTVSSSDALPVKQTHRWRLFNTMNALPAVYSTPIMGTYIESAQYLLGWDNFDNQMPVLSTGDCATNGIVILTDGEETGSYGSSQTTPAKAISGITCSTSSTTSQWTCLYDMIKAMYNKRNTHDDGNKYSVRTDAIGFGPEAGSSTGLAGVEGKGGGKFYLATDSAALTNAFKDIIANMSISTASVAASGVAVNALNRFEHLDQLYYSLFAPSTKIDWSGNLKRYRLKSADVNDILNDTAIDIEDTGFFKADARSYWNYTLPLSTATDKFVDGSNVSVGGAAGKTLPASRLVYTYLGTNAAANETALTDQITISNSSINKTLLGVTDLPYYGTGALSTATQQSARRDAVIEFLRAAPVTDTTIRWGAAIHASPRIVTFDPQAEDGSGNPAPISTVFYGDNRGFLHAINAGELSSDDDLENANNTGGKELWAFAPKEFLKNAAFFYDNTETIAGDGYRWGFDGDITLYRDKLIGAPSKVYLFAGMRRGGKNYYGLDVSKAHIGTSTATERLPKIKWIIEGGAGDFADMGETWSGMATGKVKIAGSAKQILAFTGGYDPAYHDDGSFTDLEGVGFTNTNQKGRGLYIVDMETGDLVVKTTSLSTSTFPALAYMKYSMVATPRLLDRNSDGYADAVYVVDLAGQVFRIELTTNASSATALVKNVILVAQLGATASGASATADNRRFYEPPSFARVGADILVAISSGYREEARSKVTKEAFILFKDTDAYKTGATANTVRKLADLDNLTGTAASVTADSSKPGWYIYFDQSIAEKGIGSPLIFNFSVLFSAWNSQNADVECSPDIGQTRLYLMSLAGEGLAGADDDGDGTEEAGEQSRYVDIKLPGFGDSPQVLVQDGELAVAVGIRVVDGEVICNDALANCPLDETAGIGTGRTWSRSRWEIIERD